MISTAGKGQTLVDDPAARLLIKETYSRMYKCLAGFPGYRAQVLWRRVSFGDRGLVKIRVIELSTHEVL